MSISEGRRWAAGGALTPRAGQGCSPRSSADHLLQPTALDSHPHCGAEAKDTSAVLWPPGRKLGQTPSFFFPSKNEI